MKPYLPLLIALAFATPLYAEPVSDAVAEPAASASALSEGVVRKIDAANAKVTLRHGPLENLDMPPMTMVFRVDPPSLLDSVKVGDSVRFRAEQIGGVYTVTQIEAAP